MIKVEFTQTAEEDYLALLDELSRRSLDTALELDTKLDTLIENLQQFKHLCPPSKNFRKYRRCVITRFISMVYEVGRQFKDTFHSIVWLQCRWRPINRSFS